jgi:hypothetical protein
MSVLSAMSARTSCATNLFTLHAFAMLLNYIIILYVDLLETSLQHIFIAPHMDMFTSEDERSNVPALPHKYFKECPYVYSKSRTRI